MTTTTTDRESVLPCGQTLPQGTIVLTQEHETGVALIPTPTVDPQDPLNWHMLRKVFHLCLLSATTVLAFTAVSVQPVFWTLMLTDLGVSYQDLANAQAVQLMGLSFGCVIFIPFAKKFGRRPIYITSTLIVALASWWSRYMTSLVELYLTNLLVGLAGAVNETAAQMTIVDMFFVHQRGRANGVYIFAMMLGATVVPMLASIQAVQAGWRVSYLTLAASASGLTAVFLLAFEETKFIRDTGPPALGHVESSAAETSKVQVSHAEFEPPQQTTSTDTTEQSFPCRLRLRFLTTTGESLWKLFYYPVHMLYFPHVLFTSLQFGLGVLWVVLLGSATSIIFSAPPYSFNAAGIGYLLSAPCVGSIGGVLYGGLIVDKAILFFARRNNNIFEPEMRLYLFLLPAVSTAVGLIVYGITVQKQMHWIHPAIGSVLVGFGSSAGADIALTLVLDAHPELVGLAFVVVSFFRNLISIGGSFAIVPWLRSMGPQNMFILTGCLSFVFSCLSIPLVIWGKVIRLRLGVRYRRVVEGYESVYSSM